MKKILFLMAYPLEASNRHLTQKFDGQIEATRKLGYDTWYTAYEQGEIYLCNKDKKIFLGKSINTNQNIIQSHFIYKKINKILKNQQFDICYVRRVRPIPSYLSALKKVKESKCKVIVEIPSHRNNPSKKELNRKFHNIMIDILEFLYSKKVPQFVDLYTLIGDVADSYEGVKALNIQNGVDIDSLPLKRKTQYDDKEFHILALACMYTIQSIYKSH